MQRFKKGRKDVKRVVYEKGSTCRLYMCRDILIKSTVIEVTARVADDPSRALECGRSHLVWRWPSEVWVERLRSQRLCANGVEARYDPRLLALPHTLVSA